MPGIPILTIPEGAYNPNAYTLSPASRQSRIVVYLIKLTHGSAVALVLAYAVGFFVLKPLLETNAVRRLELLELFRGKLRDCYLNLIGRVSYIPIVAKKKNNDGKLYADAVIQTDDSFLDKNRHRNKAEEEEEELAKDKLYQNRMVKKLNKLSEKLNECIPYSTEKLSYYKSTNFSIKDFQNKADLKYFNYSEFISTEIPAEGDKPARKKNIAVETQNEIRSIKGLYMSGQV
ncbi:predicted protein [Scheffersomyces stipitis CBS 6054]|uniref:Uncharacterized protein n=1 Tax=Scheffersomyces stipitis (strain ATCC 58785 / CBS 6054 / NBRC 10063 / NRRL Y-11545) TaxID=322104 RepID=A3LTV9_PICST|nr:predicted protein [Scheffersomyces stipitis CBS 6054]ABN66132.2 predicted protein [Scheffersomyces stipitis CBS 6054]